MKQISIRILLVFAFNPLFSNAQTDSILMHTFEEVDSLMVSTPKKVVVFFYTDWCKYCEQMKQTTFVNTEIIQLLNQHFYFIAFNGESREDVIYAGQTFKYLPNGQNTGVHEIAKALATINGKLNYPSLSILHSSREIIFQHYGLLSWKNLKTILTATLATPSK